MNFTDSFEIIEYIHRVFAKELSFDQDTEFDPYWSPIFIDDAPLYKWVNGSTYYGFVNVRSRDLVVTFAKSASHAAKGFGSVSLTQILTAHSGLTHLAEMGVVDKNAAYTTTIDSIYSFVPFSGINIISAEYALIKKSVQEKTLFTIDGFTIPPQLGDNKNYLADWLDKYSWFVHFQLIDFYWSVLKSSPSAFSFSKFRKMNEFIPIAIKFDGIYNPLFEGVFLQRDYATNTLKQMSPWEHLCDKYRIFSLAIPIKIASSNRIVEEIPTLYLSTRAEIQRALGVPMSPKAQATPDLWDAMLCNKVLYETALSKQLDPFAPNSWCKCVENDKTTAISNKNSNNFIRDCDIPIPTTTEALFERYAARVYSGATASAKQSVLDRFLAVTPVMLEEATSNDF